MLFTFRTSHEPKSGQQPPPNSVALKAAADAPGQGSHFHHQSPKPASQSKTHSGVDEDPAPELIVVDDDDDDDDELMNVEAPEDWNAPISQRLR
jgi:hypothetical protein